MRLYDHMLEKEGREYHQDGVVISMKVSGKRRKEGPRKDGYITSGMT